MGTPRQKIKTAGRGLPNIQKLEIYCKGLSEQASGAKTAQAW